MCFWNPLSVQIEFWLMYNMADSEAKKKQLKQQKQKKQLKQKNHKLKRSPHGIPPKQKHCMLNTCKQKLLIQTGFMELLYLKDSSQMQNPILDTNHLLKPTKWYGEI